MDFGLLRWCAGDDGDASASLTEILSRLLATDDETMDSVSEPQS